MDDYEYIKKMDRIGFKLMFTIAILAVWAICFNGTKYSFMTTYIFIGIVIVGIAGIICGHISNKKQFAKGEQHE